MSFRLRELPVFHIRDTSYPIFGHFPVFIIFVNYLNKILTETTDAHIFSYTDNANVNLRDIVGSDRDIMK